MINLIEKRKSVREYADKPLSEAQKSGVLAIMGDAPRLLGGEAIQIELFEDGESVVKLLDGVAGYEGHIIKAPSYIVISVKDGENSSKAAGYAAEWIAIKLCELELGSCWISTENREKEISDLLKINEPYTVSCILALGNPQKKSFLASIFGNNGIAERTAYQSVELKNPDALAKLGLDEIVFQDKYGLAANLEELEMAGYISAFMNMRFAPSALNKQPWRFVLTKEGIALLVSVDETAKNNNLIEAGIAMLYFKEGITASGFDGYWDLDYKNAEIEQDSYKVMGIFKSKI